MWLHKEQSLETLGKNINKTFNHIQRIVDTTMSHGKNAENCLKLAKKELGAIKNEGATIIMKHMNDVEAQFNLACSFMTTFKEAAKTVTNNLDQIFTLCNTEFTIAPNCVIYSWIDIQPQIQGFRNKSVWCTELIDLIMPWMTKSFLAKLTERPRTCFGRQAPLENLGLETLRMKNFPISESTHPQILEFPECEITKFVGFEISELESLQLSQFEVVEYLAS
ncbi:hypothetical protein KM043_018606 [Ampulex compressa]|nr:hypothetical protein KM043_018606 [Ampulex compressa]